MVDNRMVEADKAARMLLQSSFKREVISMILCELPVKDDDLMDYVYSFIQEWDK